ncbi:MAG TPA: hypothetical protein VME63_08605 [Dyella sp.]|uniref:hypothetical protein n=1 Tax=Dyella sp. TaxID=1869338 RepID=UPI002CED8714|nr:hypothetical protein [Dyella sp.]HTV85453.1 hypothetical protein [Dyella sp.]
MSISSVSSTQSQPISGLVAPLYLHPKKVPGRSVTPASIASTDVSTQGASQMAAAVAAALSQLGLTGMPGKASAVAATTVAAASGTDADARGNNAPAASQLQQQKASPQLQQYKNVAANFSNLAQALGSVAGGASPAANGSGNLTGVFQNLWTSMGVLPNEVSSGTAPSLPAFLQALAQQIGESGIAGLRGVFVDTTA